MESKKIILDKSISILVVVALILSNVQMTIVGANTSEIQETPLVAASLGGVGCAITNTGALKCWGYNRFGELGIGNTNISWLSVTPNGMESNVKKVDHSTCALKVTGALYCWGLNNVGQVGDGTTINRLFPVQVQILGDNVIDFDTSGASGCAILIAGNVKCWGLNSNGQLGTGDTTNRLLPVDVVGLSESVKHIGVGGVSCVVTVSSKVYCWGGSTVNSLTPIQILGIPFEEITQLSVGGGHACILVASGSVYCWGDNQYGQLGDGSTSNRPSAIRVNALGSNIKFINLFAGSSCSVTLLGNVKCWGGGLTPISNVGVSLVPIDIPMWDNNIIAVNNRCALKTDGSIMCLGENAEGFLGNDPQQIFSSTVPIPVVGFGNTPICGTNLLSNPGFEGGLSNWNRWDATSSDTAAPYTGSRALKLAGTAGGVGQVVVATPGRTYTANGWGKITGGAIGRMGIRFYNSSWSTLDTIVRDITGDQYQPYRIEQTAPPGTAFAELWVNHTNDLGEQHADELCLFANGSGTPATPTPTATAVGPTSTPTATATSVGPTSTSTRTPTATATPVGPTPTLTATPQPSTCTANLLSNAGFEQSFTGWVRWDANNAIAADARSGTKSLRLGTAASGIGQGITVSPGQRYDLTAYAKRQNSSASAVLGLTFFDDQWRGINAQSVANVTASSYTPYSISGVAPATARYAIAWLSKQAADSGYVFADDFCLTGASAQGGAIAASLRQNADGTWSSAEAVRQFETYLPMLAN